MTRIRYYFLIFKKDATNGLVPAIFNMKQLTQAHTPLLKRIQYLIQTAIPQIYGILEHSRKELTNYKLFLYLLLLI